MPFFQSPRQSSIGQVRYYYWCHCHQSSIYNNSRTCPANSVIFKTSLLQIEKDVYFFLRSYLDYALPLSPVFRRRSKKTPIFFKRVGWKMNLRLGSHYSLVINYNERHVKVVGWRVECRSYKTFYTYTLRIVTKSNILSFKIATAQWYCCYNLQAWYATLFVGQLTPLHSVLAKQFKYLCTFDIFMSKYSLNKSTPGLQNPFYLPCETWF